MHLGQLHSVGRKVVRGEGKSCPSVALAFTSTRKYAHAKTGGLFDEKTIKFRALCVKLVATVQE